MPPRPPSSTLFPYTTLFRSGVSRAVRGARDALRASGTRRDGSPNGECRKPGVDRKSTRLNSSHEWISYAVFCLKKKKDKNNGASWIDEASTQLFLSQQRCVR